MKQILYSFHFRAIVVVFLGLIPAKAVFAQNFQRQYGTAFDNGFTKVLRSGSNYYALGFDQPSAGSVRRATVSRLNATGQHQWTLSLDIGSVWNDAVVTPNGNLLVVGATLPVTATNQSLMALVTPAGAFTFARSYNAPGRESFRKIVRNPAPQSASFPYYILGAQADAGNPAWDDVVLLNVSEAGTFNWKKIYANDQDDKFSQEMEAMPNGDLMMAGHWGSDGVIFRVDNAGVLQGGATPFTASVSYADVARNTAGGFYAVANTIGSGVPYVMKYDMDLIPVWEAVLPGLTTVSQVWEEPANGWVYVTGTGTFGGKTRAVVLRLIESGGQPGLDWLRFLDNGETNYQGGATTFLSPNQIAFTDSRLPGSGGFGQLCAFISVSDLELASCITDEGFINTDNTSLLYNSPALLNVNFYDTPPQTNLVASALNWQQQEVCSTVPCVADFTFQFNNCSPTVFFTNTSTGPPPLSYSWNFGYSSGGVPNTSVATNPVHTFPAQCATYNVCLTVTGNGCSNTICKNITLKYPQNPVITCPPNVSVSCDNNLLPPATGTASLTNACSGAKPPISYADNISGNLPCDGSVLRTWTIVDECGGIHSCVQIITVRDNVAPQINCPPNVVRDCDKNLLPTGTGTATATDNCDPAPAVSYSDISAGLMPCDGVVNRTWRVVDKCGNKSSCLQVIRIEDKTSPMIECPLSISIPASGCPVLVGNLQPGLVSDNCGTPTVSYVITGASSGFGPNDASGSNFNQGVSTVTYTATDFCGNKATCSFKVTVVCDAGGTSKLCGQAVLTCFSGFNNPNNPQSGLKANGNVVALVDPRALTNVPANGMDASNPANGLPNVPMVKDPQWVYSRMGQVFGLAIDANEFVYATASTIYGKFKLPPLFVIDVTFGTAGAGGIYKVDPSTGTVTDFVTTTTTNLNPVGTNMIYNTGSGLGNICYDKTYNQFFVTSFTDGKIYRININGIVQSTYDHPGSQTFAATDPTYIPLGDRPYAVQVHPQNGRLYYTVWREDLGRQSGTASNEVWSIALDNTGNFQGSASLVLQLPPMPAFNYSNAPSDLAFAQSGKMLVGERSSSRDWPVFVGSPAHDSRVLEFCCDPVWGPASTFYVGNYSANTNCAGGIDYGYDGYDFLQNKPQGCDGLIWSTGDALKFGASYSPYSNDYEVVYGLAGLPATGNSNVTNSANWVKTTSYYIDMGLPGKTEFGDVEVFKCECPMQPVGFPCDSIWVTKTQPDTGKCCFNMTLDIHAGPVAYFEAESLTPGVVFNNVTLGSAFTWAGIPNGTLLPIKHNPFQGIPQGTYPNALSFCLGNILNNTQVPQCVVFRWYVKGPDDKPYLACTDTCYFECPVPVLADTCVVVKTDSISCDPANPLEYCLYLTVQNTSTDLTFIANQLLLSGLTPGFSFKPCPPPVISGTAPSIALNIVPPIAPGGTSNQLCVKLVGLTPVLSPTVVCMNLGISGSNDCCHSSIPFCVTLEPCCDPCEDRNLLVHTTDPDSCCHSLDITNDCNFNFFTKFELELLTPGVIFGSHYTGGPNPGDWSNPISQNTLVQWQHVSGFVPNGAIAGLINFCLDEIDSPSEIPQMVALHWITVGPNGKDSIACSDTLIFECPQQDFPCIEVLADTVLCKKDANGNTYYQYILTFKNTSSPPHTADELVFTQLGPPPVTVWPNPVLLIPPLASGNVTTVTTDIYGSGLNPGDKLTFEVRLHDSTDPDDWCCFEGDTLCIFIPPCDTCICGTFTDFFWRPAQGAPSQQVHCGDTLNVFCNPNFNPLLNGQFMCLGNSCDPKFPDVNWVLRRLPTGPVIASGNLQNLPGFSLSLLAAYFNTAGFYELTLSTNCNGISCLPCTFVIKADGCSCCENFDLFCQNVLGTTAIAVDPVKCKLTLNIGPLPDCDMIQWVNWGDGTLQQGPFMAGGMPMHTYAQGGAYVVSWLAVEKNNGAICFEKVLYDTITLNCGDLCPNNLVPNPSFESFISCPTGYAPPFTASAWTLPTGGSADYFNTCATAASGVSIPANFFGNQMARTGSGYAGFILRSGGNYREYLEVPLNAPLVAGNYQVSFYLSFGESSAYAIDKIGTYLSVGSVGPVSGNTVLPYLPQVSNPSGNYINDATNWTLISGTFTAAGGETHLVIGNFYDDNTTVPQPAHGGYQGAYYYIDDVCLSAVSPPSDSCCADFEAFSQTIENAVNISFVDSLCKATVQIGALPNCYKIKRIDWGDSTTTAGPFMGGDMVMHTYSGNGNYVISYVAEAYDLQSTPPKVCFEKQFNFLVFFEDCGPPPDAPCCAYEINLVNRYQDGRIKKVRLTALCDTKICCADPDEWAQVMEKPNYVEWFPADSSGLPYGAAIDNDFIVFLENGVTPHDFQVEWFDAAGAVVCRHLISMDCNGQYSDDEDWLKYTSKTALDDPNLLVFAVREPDADDEAEDCNEELRTSGCPIKYQVFCNLGNEYVVQLSTHPLYDKFDWEIQSDQPTPNIPEVAVPSFTLQNPGIYMVTLNAESSFLGETCTGGYAEIIIPDIKPWFEWQMLPCGTDVKFKPTGWGHDDYVQQITWYCTPAVPGFPVTSNTMFTHTFPVPASPLIPESYTVTMVIQDVYGCSYQIDRVITIDLSCKPDFEVDYEMCINMCPFGTTQTVKVNFTNTSTGGVCPGTTYSWNFGDGTFSPPLPGWNNATFTHDYTIPCIAGKVFQCTLTMVSPTPIPCSVQVIKPLLIKPCDVVITIDTCPNGKHLFTANVPGEWSFPGSKAIAPYPYSDKPDANGLRQKVGVWYDADGVYLVTFVGHCPGGGRCTTYIELEVKVHCYTKRDKEKFTKKDPTNSPPKWKMKNKLVQRNFKIINWGIAQKIKAKTIFKADKNLGGITYKKRKLIEIQTYFDGQIYESDCTIPCNYSLSKNTGDDSGTLTAKKAKAVDKKLGDYRSWKNSIKSTHRIRLVPNDPNTDYIINLWLGKDCDDNQWGCSHN